MVQNGILDDTCGYIGDLVGSFLVQNNVNTHETSVLHWKTEVLILVLVPILILIVIIIIIIIISKSGDALRRPLYKHVG